MKRVGIYIHIPFCVRKCNYCDFCSFPYGKGRQSDVMQRYTAELCRRIESYSDIGEREPIEADSIYFGGGTPSLLPQECVKDIFDALGRRFSVAPDAEITLECNPGTADKEYFVALHALGVNRLSIGLQSANDDELLCLGRIHDFQAFLDTFAAAREAGFDNISVDIMYGIPSQTTYSLAKTLDRLMTLSPEHISAYCLKIEEGTAFWNWRESLVLPDEDAEFEMYCLCVERLKAAGYHRYEISNFARQSKQSRHNLKYWRMEDYIGFGPAAHSCVQRVRYGNSRDLAAFLRGENIECERSTIGDSELASEYLMLSLRLESGLELSRYERLSGRDLTQLEIYRRLVAQKLLLQDGGRVRLSTEGFFVSNSIISELLPH